MANDLCSGLPRRRAKCSLLVGPPLDQRLTARPPPPPSLPHHPRAERGGRRWAHGASCGGRPPRRHAAQPVARPGGEWVDGLVGGEGASSSSALVRLPTSARQHVPPPRHPCASSTSPNTSIPPTPPLLTPPREQELLLPISDAAARAAFHPIAYFSNPKSDTQAWAFWNREQRKLCISFRGTENTVLKARARGGERRAGGGARGV